MSCTPRSLVWASANTGPAAAPAVLRAPVLRVLVPWVLVWVVRVVVTGCLLVGLRAGWGRLCCLPVWPAGVAAETAGASGRRAFGARVMVCSASGPTGADDHGVRAAGLAAVGAATDNPQAHQKGCAARRAARASVSGPPGPEGCLGRS